MGSYNCPGFPPPISSGVTIIAEKLLKVMINSHKQISHLLLVHTRLGIPMSLLVGVRIPIIEIIGGYLKTVI